MRVAVVGSGPAGVYAAAALAQHDVSADVIDRLPTPFGLVRYGVAPDHGKIKSVAAALRKVFDGDRVRFLGNVELGRDISVTDLHRHYDAFIVATGAAADRRLGIEGEDLPGSFSATEFVSWYNGHPDCLPGRFTLDAETAAIIGVGNVAVDVARVLSKMAGQLRSTDVPGHVLRALSRSRIRDVVIIGRRGPAQAKFTTKELRELGELAGTDVIVDPADLEPDAAGEAALQRNPAARHNLDVLRDWSERTPAGRPRRLHVRFLLRPVAITGQTAATGIQLARQRLDGSSRTADTGERIHLPAQLVLRSVGYRGVPVPGLPFDQDRGIVPNSSGRVLRGGVPAPGEYVTGWIKRGPTGVIGTNKQDSSETVRCLLQDAAMLPPPQTRDPDAIMALLHQRGVRVVDWRGWEAIDALEINAGLARDASRVKIADRTRLLSAAFTAPEIPVS
ncbi:MAG: FAD-dependent oxidoreductase [Acidimicrobiia bacterium]|nr:FAD-dependent oxidoreductase [Acidimicrobiia bacterium]